MRTRFVIALLAVAIATVGFAVGQRVTAEADEREEAAKIRNGAAEEANAALLRALPALDGVRFSTFTEVDGPPGGVGVQWVVTYDTDTLDQATAMLARHAEAVAGWDDVRYEPGERLVARSARQWVVATAGPAGEDLHPGFAVTINALDGPLYPKQP